jgi:hypothetical protein
MAPVFATRLCAEMSEGYVVRERSKALDRSNELWQTTCCQDPNQLFEQKIIFLLWGGL